MNNITSTPATSIFDHPTFGNHRTWKDPETGEPWFVARDVAAALGYPRSSPVFNLFRCVPKEWKGTKQISTPGGKQGMTCVSREGLLFVLGRSEKSIAQPYQCWIAGEVVPQIMDTGGYIPVKEEDDDLTILSKALQIMKRTVDQKDELIARQRETISTSSQLITKQTVTISEMKPKAAVYDNHLAGGELLTVYEFARTLEGVNAPQVSVDLYRRGYFYRVGWKFRVRSQYRDTLFQEKRDKVYDRVTIHVLDKGKRLLASLYEEGKLTMKVNHSARKVSGAKAV